MRPAQSVLYNGNMGKRIRAHAHRYQGVALGTTRRMARQAYLARRHCYLTQQGHMEAVASSYVAASDQ